MSNNRPSRYHRAGSSHRNSKTPSKQQSDLLNEFSNFCPAHLKSQLRNKILSGAIKNQVQARAFVTRVADHQTAKIDEGDWKVAGSKKTRSRNSRRPDGLSSSRRGRGRGRVDVVGGRSGRDNRSRARSEDQHRNERKDSSRRDHGHSSRHGNRSGPPRRVADNKRPNNAAPKKAAPVAVKKPQGAWAKGKPTIVVDTPKPKNRRRQQRPQQQQPAKPPPSHPVLPDVPTTGEQVANSGWATPNVTNVSESWSSLGEGGGFPAENPPAEPSEPAAPEENTEFVPHQEKVDSETNAEVPVAAPDATNAWAASAPAPASNNAWSNTTTEPVQQQTCEEIEKLMIERHASSEPPTAEPEPSPEPETFEEPLGALEEPTPEPSPVAEDPSPVDEPAFDNYAEPEPVPEETTQIEEPLPPQPPVDAEEQRPADPVHALQPDMVPSHLTAPHPNDQLLPISQRSNATYQPQQQQQPPPQQQPQPPQPQPPQPQPPQQRAPQYVSSMSTAAPPGMMPEQTIPDRMMHPSHPRGPAQPQQREHRGTYPQQQQQQQQQQPFGGAVPNYAQMPGAYPAAMFSQLPPMYPPYGYAAYPYPGPPYPPQVGMAQPPHMYYQRVGRDQPVYGGHGGSRGQEDPFHRGRSGPRNEGAPQPQHHRQQPQQPHPNIMDANVHPTSTPPTSLPDAPAQPGGYGGWANYGAPGTAGGYPNPAHQYHNPTPNFHHYHRQQQQPHVMRQPRGRHPGAQREPRGDM